MFSIPTRLSKLVLAGCCGLGATALFVSGKFLKDQTLIYSSYGTAAAAFLLAAQSVLPSEKEEK